MNVITSTCKYLSIGFGSFCFDFGIVGYLRGPYMFIHSIRIEPSSLFKDSGR
jgi:hypothetical protein